ncbi:PLP-dependent aminotransferase family protein [Pseudoalteromonas umbrosa]|uniref:aminotransferase-like domain-containing protein n=1 Tax=Pseudoalteromonas umbrosa TaxID=3048489 RepID=UPI0024C2958D|nr:PLP-dependent aminotransferase family protein [Pseudoalteromonas sp. B95]MDK1288854.1 PLP-dependent aminotransferase family protein [Pseudoalteromonas sp. B95]
MNQTNVMQFLNEVSAKYPQAISFAAGQPSPEFYQNESWANFIKVYEDASPLSSSLLYRYASSSGLINHEIAQFLRNDEGFSVAEQNITLTNGSQEAINLVVMKEVRNDNECVVAIEPFYIGVKEVLEGQQKRLVTLDFAKLCQGGDLSCEAFEQALQEIQSQGISIKLVYINPDFNNPLGFCMSESTRQSLIKLAVKYHFKILEDNPYSHFCYQGKRLPSIYALDNQGVTYHLGSFSKIFCPGLRVGYLVEPATKDHGERRISDYKSATSINTCALAQAVIGGFLIQNDYSFKARMAEINQHYGARKVALVEAVKQSLSPLGVKLYEEVSGGFFQTLELPFEADFEWVEKSAAQYGVIVMPVSFFCVNSTKWKRFVRLSFSYADETTIKEGISRLAKSIESQCSIV